MREIETPPNKPGPRRLRRTRLRVRLADYAAWWIITLGGLGTIAAVLLVCVFLIWVVIPLFSTPRVGEPHPAAHATLERPLHFAMDEGLALGWSLGPSGRLDVFQLSTGALIQQTNFFPENPPTASAFAPGENGGAAFGFADGSVRIVKLAVDSERLDEASSAEFKETDPGTQIVRDGRLITVEEEGVARAWSLGVQIDDAIAGSTQSPVLRLDFAVRGGNPIVASLHADGRLAMREVRKRKNMMTGKTTTQVNEGGIELPPERRDHPPDFIRMTGLGDNVYLIWRDGRLARIDTRDYQGLKEAEQVNLLPEGQAEVTCTEWLIGRTSLAVGDSTGRTRIWFRIKPETGNYVDGTRLVAAHTLDGPITPAAVTALAASGRTRVIAAGYANGVTRIFQVTTGSMLKELPPSPNADGVVQAVALGPKENAIATAGGGGLTRWSLDLMHPEAGIAAYFRPIWYEGYPGPQHVWQSSSGTDDFEPKLGLVPLVFGTLKATFYSMIFGVPLALLAAIYCSEFLNPRAKGRIKPAIEMMASLPSVVLGFLAALVFAPFAEEYIPEILTGFMTMPLALLLGSFLWQALPRRWHLRLNKLRLGLIAAAFGAGLLAATRLAPMVEHLLFAGDIKQWLSGHAGSAWGGWFYLLLPVSGVLVVWMFARIGEPFMRGMYDRIPGHLIGLLELARFIAGVMVVLGITALSAFAVTAAGFDPRGAVVGTYVQRNALIVGFVMGFAVIPIIYTIAEDALASVPSHLRSASLAAGATPWQTAIRVIIPTATSGLFSAVMIGLGRAVGETMIVLMAAGNTSVMEWNIFNGFRTLSANIAVELPEAVRNSTHYRTLFLAALSLFILTFILNTCAELVRRRFRKRTVQL